MSYEPNKYQKDILKWVMEERGNALVEARAGCGKTSTLVLLANLITEELNKKCLFLAFNDHIAKEIRAKLQKKVDNKEIMVRTINSLGNSFLYGWLFAEKRKKNDTDDFSIDVDDNKMYKIGKTLIDDYLYKNGLITEVTDDDLYALYFEFRKYCDLARTTCCDYTNPNYLKSLKARYNLFEDLKVYDDLRIPYEEFVETAIETSVNYFINGVYNSKQKKNIHVIDFTEQLFLPLKLKMWAPKTITEFGKDFILVDEAQDLSTAQHRLLKKFTNKYLSPRYIFVADELQSIYGFSGADTRSVENLNFNFDLKRLPLNICYRCPKKHIKVIQKLVPDIEENPNGIDGTIHIISNKEVAESVEVGDYIIARKNKDLVETMLSVLEAGKRIFVKDKNLVSTTVQNIKKLKCKNIKSLEKELLCLQDAYRAQQKNPEARSSSSAISNNSADIFDTIFILLDNFKKHSSKDDIDSFIDDITDTLNVDNSKPSVVLSSVHGVKGGEANNVYILNYPDFPYVSEANTVDQNQQEKNLQYIALSRSKDKMYLCKDDE